MTKNVPVCIIGCGPIGLTGALLLSRFGIQVLLVERRAELNTHPRSRFVDTNTMELMREFGLEKAVEETGLGPEWTQFNRWADSLSTSEYATIPSPTFHTVARDTSPCLPVMTCQDYVEQVLMSKIQDDPNIDVRFHTEALNLTQDESETRLVLRNSQTGTEEEIVAQYTIGADGPGSTTRDVIGVRLEADPRPVNSQDVIFDADLSKYVGDRKGALLYNTTAMGKLVIFQPLDGRRRWRCQITIPDPDLISEDEAIGRIREALGTEDEVPIRIVSMSLWQPTPGCTTHFSKGRIFLAGDAAHVAIPAGGLGNNTGFAGIRNLAWKLAFVLRGISPPEILDTYEEEHKPLAEARIEVGVRIFEAMAPMMIKHLTGQDIAAEVHATRLYGNYDGSLMGFELRSRLLAVDPGDPPPVDDPVIDFVPVVRSGRRAPHVWVDDAKSRSVLDGFGDGYNLVIGADVDAKPWSDAVARLAEQGFPISVQCMPPMDEASPYSDADLVLVRPDGIIASHWHEGAVAPTDIASRLRSVLPLAAASDSATALR